ncbi:hypothetical protein NQZ68_040643 [Dissostichus eleginoides]|nr:hypothetical protein NQZ68_040643 [Dissostichus eleginoides]
METSTSECVQTSLARFGPPSAQRILTCYNLSACLLWLCLSAEACTVSCSVMEESLFHLGLNGKQDLSHNKLRVLDGTLFSKLQHLSEIKLNHNELEEIPDLGPHASNLTTLILAVSWKSPPPFPRESKVFWLSRSQTGRLRHGSHAQTEPLSWEGSEEKRARVSSSTYSNSQSDRAAALSDLAAQRKNNGNNPAAVELQGLSLVDRQEVRRPSPPERNWKYWFSLTGGLPSLSEQSGEHEN